jgi:hypothetical protein
VCFTFWYHALGDSVGALRVYTTNDTNISDRKLLWEINGKQSLDQKDWKQGILPITNLANDYKILIEATVGKGDNFNTYYGDIS